MSEQTKPTAYGTHVTGKWGSADVTSKHPEWRDYAVRAVNSHAALVEALEFAVAEMPHASACDAVPCDCWREKARAAIKLARGEA